MQTERSQRGFTLLEVLVALAVVAIAMGALISSGGHAARTASGLEERLFAHWVASNRLVQLRLQPGWPKIGKDSGTEQMAGRKWQWRQEVTATPEKRVRKVTVRVSNRAGEEVTRLVGYISDAGSRGS